MHSRGGHPTPAPAHVPVPHYVSGGGDRWGRVGSCLKVVGDVRGWSGGQGVIATGVEARVG